MALRQTVYNYRRFRSARRHANGVLLSKILIAEDRPAMVFDPLAIYVLGGFIKQPRS